MDLIIVAVIVIAAAVVMEVRIIKHEKPMKENLQAVQRMKSVAKSMNLHGHHNA